MLYVNVNFEIEIAVEKCMKTYFWFFTILHIVKQIRVDKENRMIILNLSQGRAFSNEEEVVVSQISFNLSSSHHRLQRQFHSKPKMRKNFLKTSKYLRNECTDKYHKYTSIINEYHDMEFTFVLVSRIKSHKEYHMHNVSM